MRRFLIAALVAVFFWASVVNPARAVLPVVAGAIAVLTEGTATTNAIAALTVGTLVGMAWLKSQSGSTSDTSGEFGGVPLGTRTAAQLPTPAGWSGPTIPPSSAIVSYSYSMTGVTGTFTSGAAICEQYRVNSYPADSPSAWAPNAADTGCNRNGSLWQTYQKALTCPAGYTVSGSSCVLSNASAVQKPADGRCDVLATVSGFTVDPQDPECGDLASRGVTVSPTQATAKSTKGDSIDIVINPDGSRTMTITKVNANGTTTTTRITTIPAQGGAVAQITGTQTSTVAGTGTGATGAVAVTPLDLQLPTDYNREATQQAIRDKLTTIDSKLDTSGQDTSLSGKSAAVDSATTSVTNQLDSIAAAGVAHGWTWPMPDLPAGGGCQPLAMTYKGHSASFDWCPSLALLRDVLGWLAYIATSFYLLRLFGRTLRGA